MHFADAKEQVALYIAFWLTTQPCLAPSLQLPGSLSRRPSGHSPQAVLHKELCQIRTGPTDPQRTAVVRHGLYL